MSSFASTLSSAKTFNRRTLEFALSGTLFFYPEKLLREGTAPVACAPSPELLKGPLCQVLWTFHRPVLDRSVCQQVTHSPCLHLRAQTRWAFLLLNTPFTFSEAKAKQGRVGSEALDERGGVNRQRKGSVWQTWLEKKTMLIISQASCGNKGFIAAADYK